jgi:hypothetical protein
MLRFSHDFSASNIQKLYKMPENGNMNLSRKGRIFVGGGAFMIDGFFDGIIPIGAARNSLERAFLSLPEETQQRLLQKGGDTEEGLRRNLEELSMRE